MTAAIAETPPPIPPAETDQHVLRGEVFSLGHLEQHARQFAASLVLAPRPTKDREFARRFEANARFLRRAYESVSAAVQSGEPLTQDAEWLLDNFYVVEEQLREIHDDLPQRYYWELPKLANGHPRVYALAVELIVHTDSALDEEAIVRFVREFQTVAPLSIGEVWAVPIMLRLGVVENLRRLAGQMLEARRCREEARRLVAAWREHEEFPLDFSSLDKCAPVVIHLLEQLQEQGAASAAAIRRVEEQLTRHQLDAQDIARFEHQRQAANQVSIGNVITSMRLISALDWVIFFERTNHAEQVLRQDPAGVYPQMDFESRDRYRHAVEQLAKGSNLTDVEVAGRALAAARSHFADPVAASEEHVGYWLVDRGRELLEAELPYRPTSRQRLARWLTKHPGAAYFGSVGGITGFAVVALALVAWASGLPAAFCALVACLALLPASELAVNLTNLIITSWLPPHLLPKLEFKDGVPPECAAFVVVPCMLTSRREVHSLLERLETHYLANPEPALRFALLTDLADADAQHLPGDRDLTALAAQGVRDLNVRYFPDGGGPFFLFHRERRWNASEGRWMGWERKRGKLMEFNRLIRGANDTSYVLQEGDHALLESIDQPEAIQFVITLDADTQLPYGSARRMIGTLAHPLNRPRFDPARGCVTRGYSVVQPRVSVHLASANRTRFSRIYANSPGIDPYTTCASDVYQDLFGEGSFTGKGIYDVDALEQSLGAAFPENQILSHDLIEGCHARVALASDIELIDGFPARYDADARRQHRWVRGDWQILPWLLPRVPTATTGWRANPLTLLSRWKIFDNLRRSMVPPAVLVFLLTMWLLWPPLAWLGTSFALVVLAFPLLAQVALTLRRWPRGIAWQQQAQSITRDTWRSFVQTVLVVSFLPYQALSMLDAIGRTLLRMLVTRRGLLEWETAADAERRLSQSRWSTLRQMWWVPALAVVVALLLEPWAWPPAAPLLLAWLSAPLTADWISRPIAMRVKGLTAQQEQWLRFTARKMWGYFETYVGPEDHWLPPDNLQEYPSEKIAHRVSPTNAGLLLASALAARDCGYIGIFALAELWERSLDNLMRLERLNGHFYNWYDTLTLQPLFPRYVSTVDSGNLAACLLTVQQGIADVRGASVLSAAHWKGLHDTVEVALEACEQLHPRGARIVSPPLDDLIDAVTALQRHGIDPPRSLIAWHATIATLREDAARLREMLTAYQSSGLFPDTDAPPKVQSLIRWIEGIEVDCRALFPWMEVAEQLRPEAASPSAGIGGPPQLPWAGIGAGCQDKWRQLWTALGERQSLTAVKEIAGGLNSDLTGLRSLVAAEAALTDRDAALRWVDALATSIESAAGAAAELEQRYEQLASRMEALALGMDFRFLFNLQRRLFAIGFNIEDGTLDRSHYDMLCSEARLASYLAIAKGDAEPRHWFQLGRQLTQTAGQVSLLSWGGTMFEYLMPPIFQRDYEGSLLAQSCRAAVARQRQYGKQHGVPWGISESAFGALAVNSDYHYRSFGVPGLGLKRGLAKDLVVSPYSTMMALEIDPSAAYDNLQALAGEGGLGAWGPYDAIDYTPHRLPAGKRSIIVRCYMAHHQGMSLLAVANLLFAGCIRRRFHSHPLPRASELLLQERVPTAAPYVEPHADEVAVVEVPRLEDEIVSRRLRGIDTPAPRTHLLANGQYSVMLTSTGGGYSRWRDIAMTRWRSDTTCDAWGQFIYLRDPRTGRLWSPTHQPTCAAADAYEVTFSIDKAEFHRRDGDLESHLEVAVSPENNAEVRQLKITNHGSQTRQIEVTSYAEVVLNTQGADLAHPAFQKLFIETEYIAEETALVARRRPRDSRQAPLFAVHVLAGEDGAVQYETSRQAFLGRGRTPYRPASLDPGARLTGQTGAVLDPIFALRTLVTVRPHESATVAFTTALATSREEALALADQYHDSRGVQRAFELAWAYNQVQLRHLHLSPAKAHLYQRLSAAILYPDPQRRGSRQAMLANRQGQSGLWRYGISGDLPIVLIHVTKPEHVNHVRELLAAHAYWQNHGLAVDLAILNDYPGSYMDALHEQLVTLLSEAPHRTEDRPGRAYLLRGAQLQREDKDLLETVAAVVLHGERGSIGQQWETASPPPTPEARLRRPGSTGFRRRSMASPGPRRGTAPVTTGEGAARRAAARQQEIQKLEFWNGTGGFALDGREYRILLTGGGMTPMPWSNVIANEAFGTLVTETGGGFTWSGNSRENKLTTWSNDPVIDAPSEALYVRDEETGEYWSPLSAALKSSGDYWIHHGQGYSRFLHQTAGIDHDVLVSIAPDDPVKFIHVKLRNTGQMARELSLTYFVEWVLGAAREQTQLGVQTETHAASGAVLARNYYRAAFSEEVAFIHVLGTTRTCTGDRGEFLGRNGDVRRPQALEQLQLSGRTGPGLDPCGAVQTKLRLPARGEVEVIFLLGAGSNLASAEALLAKFNGVSAVERACQETASRWDDVLGALQVKTPNRAMDLLVNRWLLYQTLSCRVWGRSAFYQSGGAYGFRDQLQDVMALVFSRPDLVREHLLRAASRQFEEGDVQHWWHPPAGAGTRTRFADDLLWLPFVACHYVRTTGDSAVLDAEAPFLQSPALEPHEHERYELPNVAASTGSLYEHCRRAIERGMRTGPHGLPLMGCGDWNDGLNRVGELGQGESVWAGWFLLVILREFVPIMLARGDQDAAREYQSRADALRQAMETHAWDGQWYLRAFFDDGSLLGSAQNDECQIDSIAQTWAVLAGAQPHRTQLAIQAVLQRLVRREDRLVLLFAPPFDRTALDPGYIKGYLPGIRENGGQYTHPALWLIQALAQMGSADEALSLYDMINPIHHARTPKEVARYQVEPYVVAADVYGVAPHTGRGGWTWYTGSAAWMYRVAVESLLGLQLRGNRLRVVPCLPAFWEGFEFTLRRGGTTWRISLQRADDASPGDSGRAEIELNQDGETHEMTLAILPAVGKHQV